MALDRRKNMINRVVLIGRLTKDPVLRKTLNDKSVVQFTLACNRNVSKDGEQNVDFINCIAWNKVAELMVQYLHKGSLIGIDGRIQTRNYQDKSGRTVYLTEVVVEQQQFLEPKSAQHSNENAQGYNHAMQSNFNESSNYNGYQDMRNYQKDTVDISSDDLPF